MPFHPSRDPSADPLVSQPRRAPPALIAAGVAGACVLGAGLGLWARPSSDDGELLAHRAVSAPAAASPWQIEIRVDRPPPVPAEPPPAVEVAAPPDPAPPPELLAPKRPPEGLVKAHAVAPERLVDVEEVSERKARAAAERRTRAKAEAETLAARKAKAERSAREAEAREARAEAKAAAMRKAKVESARIAEVAEAKARARAAEKKSARRLAEEKRRTTPKSVAAASRPPAKATKLAKASTRCASPDPGEALACSDPALGAAERQLSRAYRQAEAAGVPPETLERQQRRWLAARANAAREAPWAVHDIYLARIAELHDQTRHASRGE